MLAGAPLAAQTPGTQTPGTETDLKALIPDTALAHPEDWAKAPGAEGDRGQESGNTASGINPGSPLPDIPGLDLDWPDRHLDLPPLPILVPEPDGLDAQSAPIAVPAVELPRQEEGTQRDRLASGRLLLDWQGIAPPERRAIEARFRALSALQNEPGKEREQESLAQLAVRAASDRDVLEHILRVFGYYDAEVTQTLASAVAPAAGARSASRKAQVPPVHFDIVAGSRYRFGTVALPGLEAAGADAATLRKSFAIVSGDPLDSDTIVAETGHLDTALGENGYPFAKIAPASLTVDHEREEGDLTMQVTPGAQYRFGAIESENPRFLSSRHLARIARFRPGQLYRRSEVDDFRRAILATGLVSSLTVTPRAEARPGEAGVSEAGASEAGAGAAGPASIAAPAATTPAPASAPSSPSSPEPGTVALDVAMKPAPLRSISAGAGYDTEEGFLLETSWEDRNLFPPEGSLRLRGIAGTDEQLAGVTFRRNNFDGRDHTLSFDLYAQNANLIAFAARKVAFSATYERQTTLIFQKPWTWSIGAGAEASDEREGAPTGTPAIACPGSCLPPRHLYVTGSLPLRAAYDGSDSLLDPHHGWRVALSVSPQVSFTQGVTSPFVMIEGDASTYLPLAPGVVFAGRGRLGSILGTALDNIAPSHRFYAGGGGSIRGFGYDLVGPRNSYTEPEGGRSVYELSGEMRFHTALLGGALSLAPFLDTGGAETGSAPTFGAMRYGAGLGFLYASGFGPIHVDIGTPLDPHPGDSRIGVYISLGQAF